MTSWLWSSENLLKSHDRIGGSTFQVFFPVAEGLFFRKINCFPVKHKKNFYFESSQTLERGCSGRLWSHSTQSQYNPIVQGQATCSCWPYFKPRGWIRLSMEVPSSFSHSAILSRHNKGGLPYLFGACNFINILLPTFSLTKDKPRAKSELY